MMYGLLSITAKGMQMQETDPHGLTLTLIAVFTVFLALIILCLIYNLSGNIFSGKYKKARAERKAAKAASAKGNVDGEIATAIAMALNAAEGSETEVAIAAALHLYLSGSAHDGGPYVITFARKDSTWNDKILNFRKNL